jgi:hypothetical protein
MQKQNRRKDEADQGDSDACGEREMKFIRMMIEGKKQKDAETENEHFPR